MAQPQLAAVVSYCSNERMFARALLRNALAATPHVFVAVGCRLYTGEPEDEAHLVALHAEFPAARFVVYDVGDDALARPIGLHNEARRAGVAAARAACGDDVWVLLLDGDEVPDGGALAGWWAARGPSLHPGTALKMANWWYFLSPLLVADVHEDSVVIVHISCLSDAALSHPRERDGVLMHNQCTGGPISSVERMVYGLDGCTPMFHHFSWVRAGRAGLLAKVANWGHRHDRPWAALVNAACDAVQGETSGWPHQDFVHGHALRVLERSPFEELQPRQVGPPSATNC